LYKKYNYGLIGWSPLCGGVLTGKHLDGVREDELNRFTDKNSSLPLELVKKVYSLHFSNKTDQSLI
jgi:aryl-alcohol dehydrogenase-like predicted oxidoreductase